MFNFVITFLGMFWLTHQGVDYIDQQSWGGICINGTRQSPRDIPSIFQESLLKCPSDQSVQFIENSYTFLLDPDYTHALQSIFKSYTTVKHILSGTQTNYESLQFHWHFPSQHHIDGKQYDLELHIVHANSNSTKLAVVGLLFQISQVGEKFKDLFREVDFTLGPTTVAFPFRIKNQIVYHYQGSLTTPPCSQIVQWFVHTNVYSIKKEWYDYITKRINTGNRNDRDIQANMKPVYLMGPICKIKQFS